MTGPPTRSAWRTIPSIRQTLRVGPWNHLLVAKDDPEKRISELERQLAEAKGNAGQPASFPPPPTPSGWPQAAQPQPGAAGQPQAYPPAGPPPQSFPPPPSVGPTGSNLGSWPGQFQSASTGWQGRPAFAGRTLRRRRHFGWLLLVPLVFGWVFFKAPLLQFIERTANHHSAAYQSTFQSTASHPVGPKACDLLTPDIVKPVLGNDAVVAQNMQGSCAYKSSRGYASVSIGDWSSMKPSGSSQRPVPGLGDEAVFSADDLYVQKGSVGVQIMLSNGLFVGGAGDSDAKRDDAEKAVAQQLLPKL